MATLTRKGPFKGINTRVNNLFSKGGFCIDAKNVYVDINDDIVTRWGFQQHGTSAGKDGIFKYASADELLSVEATVKKFSGGTWSDTADFGASPFGSTVDGVVGSVEVDNKSIYFAKEGQELFKYDGAASYLAGMGEPSISAGLQVAGPNTVPFGDVSVADDTFTYTDHGFVTGERVEVTSADPPSGIDVSPTGLYIIYVDDDTFGFASTYDEAWAGTYIDILTQGTGNHIVTDTTLAPGGVDYIYKLEVEQSDANGNITFSLPVDSETKTPLIADGVELTIGYTRANALTGYSKSDGTQSTTANPAIFNITGGNTLVVGQMVYLKEDSGGDVAYRAYKITSVGGSTFQVANPSALTLATNGNMYISSILGRVYRQDGASATFDKLAEIPLYPIANTYLFFDNFEITLGDTYIEPAITRVLPPSESKYIEEWQGVLFVAGGSKPVEYNDVRGYFFADEAENHTVYYSSTEGDDGIETFVLGGNSLIIGDAREGIITGLKKNNDALVVFKERAMYIITGDIILGNIKVSKVQSEGIGCVSHASIQEVDGRVVFLAERGVYSYRVGEAKPVEESTAIYSKFQESGVDLTLATSAHDYINKLYLLYVPSSGTDFVIVFDYHRGGWWFWNDLDMSSGIAFYDNNFLYIDASARSQEQNDTRTDDFDGSTPVAIDSYVVAPWENGGIVSYDKKWGEVKVYSLTSPDFTLNIKVYKNFDGSTAVTDTDVTFDSDTLSQHIKIASGDKKAKTLSVKFSHSTIAKKMIITGWEVDADELFFESKNFEGPH